MNDERYFLRTIFLLLQYYYVHMREKILSMYKQKLHYKKKKHFPTSKNYVREKRQKQTKTLTTRGEYFKVKAIPPHIATKKMSNLGSI